MYRKLVMTAGALVAAALYAPAALAQVTPPAVQTGQSARTFAVTPYAGYMIFGDYLTGPLGTSVSSANAPVIGAQLGVRLTDNVAIVGNVARASSDLRIGAPIIGGVNVGSSTVMMYDAGVQLSAPLGDRTTLPITPFVQLGAGMMSHELSASILTTRSSNFAVNAGVGADVALGQNLGLRLMARDYIGRFDVQEASGLNYEGKLAHNWKLGAGLTLSF